MIFLIYPQQYLISVKIVWHLAITLLICFYLMLLNVILFAGYLFADGMLVFVLGRMRVLVCM
jgi:hypothetical protein